MFLVLPAILLPVIVWLVTSRWWVHAKDMKRAFGSLTNLAFGPEIHVIFCFLGVASLGLIVWNKFSCTEEIEESGQKDQEEANLLVVTAAILAGMVILCSLMLISYVFFDLWIYPGWSQSHLR